MRPLAAVRPLRWCREALLGAAAALLLAGCASAPPRPEPPAVSWEQTFEYPVRFQRSEIGIAHV